ncbi:uncharacterized protein LOC130758741 [Actinidia eriantha]|uniref:uncharacterized protein LOC130758741 n=1 Tax=Actinidia eriantha TaxID=165200 RepID=UPI00258BCF51|nr:uncharacterized protein LOC130758741 [Actinidia eriantha]
MCVDDLLKLNLTQQALSPHQHEEWVDGLLDGFLRLIDVCGIVRDVIKNIKKDAKKLIATMKQIEKRIGGSPLLGLDHHFSLVIRVLREVVVATNSIFRLLLLFLSVPTKRSLVSRLLHTETVACEDQHVNMNELESTDFALHTPWKCGATEGNKKQIAQHRLECLETSIEAIENCLESSFRSMIRARASLLNVVSL